MSIQIISKKWKNTIIKLSKNLSFVILIFATLKFRNFRRSTFRHSKSWPPPILVLNLFYHKNLPCTTAINIFFFSFFFFLIPMIYLTLLFQHSFQFDKLSHLNRIILTTVWITPKVGSFISNSNIFYSVFALLYNEVYSIRRVIWPVFLRFFFW